MKHVAYILVLGLAAPFAGSAQTTAAATGPVERLLGHRSELSLTADQVQRLEAIDRKYDQQNKEPVARLEALRGRPIGQPMRMRDLAVADREKLLANRQQLQPLMQQLRTSHQAAIAEARGVLTGDQNERANQYLYQGPGQGQGRGAGAAMLGRGNMPGRGAAMRGRGNMQGGGGPMGGRGFMQGGGRGMMRHSPGQGFGFGRGGRTG